MHDYRWIVELAIKQGKQAEFRSLAVDMVKEFLENEPKTRTYQFYVSEDGNSCHINERYDDAEGFKFHLDNFGEKFADRFSACVKITKFTVYGNPNEEIRNILAGFGAIFMSHMGGLAGGFEGNAPYDGISRQSSEG